MFDLDCGHRDGGGGQHSAGGERLDLNGNIGVADTFEAGVLTRTIQPVQMLPPNAVPNLHEGLIHHDRDSTLDRVGRSRGRNLFLC